MKEIKFRAWDKVEEEMFNVGAIAWSHNAFNNRSYIFGTNPHCYEDKCQSNAHINEECIFMQYTGLKDKNGKEIYEGDIVKIATVKINEGDYVIDQVFYSEFEGMYITNNGYILGRVDHRTEVIGNIYENPELLENK